MIDKLQLWPWDSEEETNLQRLVSGRLDRKDLMQGMRGGQGQFPGSALDVWVDEVARPSGRSKEEEQTCSRLSYRSSTAAFGASSEAWARKRKRERERERHQLVILALMSLFLLCPADLKYLLLMSGPSDMGHP